MGRYVGASSLENVDDIVQTLTDATIIALNENLFNQILYQQTPGDWDTATLTAPQQQALQPDYNEENFPSFGSLGGQAKHKYKKTKRKTKRKTKNLKKKSKKQKLKTKNA